MTYNFLGQSAPHHAGPAALGKPHTPSQKEVDFMNQFLGFDKAGEPARTTTSTGGGINFVPPNWFLG